MVRLRDMFGAMAAQIVLFGATGYTGELTARALVRARRAPGPRRAVARAPGGARGGPRRARARVADVDDPATRAGARRARATCSSARSGPSRASGEPAVEAAVAARAHYLDSTGEAPFIRDVFERHGPRAQRAGVGLLTAMGFDFVPGNVAGRARAARGGRARATAVRGRLLRLGLLAPAAARGPARPPRRSSRPSAGAAGRSSPSAAPPTWRPSCCAGAGARPR